MRKLTDIDVENKTVFVRVDFNVPISDGEIVDNNRIVQSLKTIEYLKNNNAKIVLVSHLGKVKDSSDFTDKSLKPVKEELESLLKTKVLFSEELIGEGLEETIRNLEPGQILLLDNIRFLDVPNKLESSSDERLSKYYSKLVDVFVFDAFATCHRCHASTYGVSKLVSERAAGFLVEEEIKKLDQIKDEEKLVILGGAKVSDKIRLIEKLLPTSKYILIGGAMCATFLKATDQNVGNTFVDEEFLMDAKKLLKNGKIVLPIDAVTEKGIMDLEDIKDETIYDIGPRTIRLFERYITGEDPVLINGTLGLYEEEKYSEGTRCIFSYLKRTKSRVIVCGGDTAAACKLFGFKPEYISTGGGASLEYLEGKEMPVLDLLK